jgi:hypothetical protein
VSEFVAPFVHFVGRHVFVFALGSVVFMLVLFWALWLRGLRRREATLRRVAERLKGTVAASDTEELQAIHFYAAGRSSRIDFESGELPSTRVKVSLSRRSPGVFRILRGDVAWEQRKFVGAKDIRVGNPRFDAGWFVTARPESLAHRIFAEDRREEAIESVRRLEIFRRPSIEITRDTLVARVEQVLRREEDILTLAATAIDFVGYLLMLGPEEGIAWVADGEEGPGTCPVCAWALTDAVVRCDRCRTPHHEECWRYVGQCSAYACKGKGFVPGSVSGHGEGVSAS